MSSRDVKSQPKGGEAPPPLNVTLMPRIAGVSMIASNIPVLASHSAEDLVEYENNPEGPSLVVNKGA